MSVTPRPVLWSGIVLEVQGPSWSAVVCHSIIGLSLLSLQAISMLCFTGKTSSSLICSPWGRDALQYLMQLVATPDTDCYFWFWSPLCSGTHYSISVSLWNLFSLCLSCWILLCTKHKYLHVKIAENKLSWQWEDLYFCWVYGIWWM